MRLSVQFCKMYLSPKLRGKGFGEKIFQYCLDEINKTDFKKCYLETIDSLETAIHIYKQFGFVQIDEPIGKTGLSSCGYYMLKDL